MTCFVEQRNDLHEAVMRFGTKQLAKLGVGNRSNLYFGATCSVILRPLEQVHELSSAIVDADERAVLVNRPRDRVTLDLEIGLHIAHELERIFADAIALVDEREDWNAAAFADRK